MLRAWEHTGDGQNGLVLKGFSFGEKTFKIIQEVAPGVGGSGLFGPRVKSFDDWLRGTEHDKNDRDVQLAYWTVRTAENCEAINGALLDVLSIFNGMGYETVEHYGLFFKFASARRHRTYIHPLKTVRHRRHSQTLGQDDLVSIADFFAVRQSWPILMAFTLSPLGS